MDSRKPPLAKASPTSISERLLLALSREPDSAEYMRGTLKTNADNALSFLLKTVPEFPSLIKDKEVLDFGCGLGWQAVAMARHGARQVTGLDLPRPLLQEHWSSLEPLPANVRLINEMPEQKFDVVLSCSSFEHFGDPAQVLSLMSSRARQGGLVVISFAEPWLSPRGSHCDNFSKLPWLNLLFPESSVMRVRSRFKHDGAMRYEDVEGGLNRMTVGKFESLIQASGLKVRCLRLHPVRGLPLVTHIPVLRELLTAAVSCILER